MTEVTILVNQAYVYAEVRKATAYLAVKNSEKSEYDRVAVVEDNADLLDRYYEEAIGILNATMRQYIDSVTNSAKTYTFNMLMSSSYDTTQNDALQTAVQSFVISYILSKWLVVVDKKEATNAEHEAAEHLTDIRAKVYYRKRPVRTPPKKVYVYPANPDTIENTPGSSEETDRGISSN